MAKTQTQKQCPIYSPVSSMINWGGNKVLDYLFDANGDSRLIQQDEEKYTMKKMTTRQSEISFPIEFIFETLVKGFRKMFSEFEIVIRQSLYSEKNNKWDIFNIVHSLLYILEVFVTKTIDFICILFYTINVDDNCYNNHINNSTNIYTNSDNNSSCNNSIDYEDNCDNNHIDNNYDNYHIDNNYDNYKANNDQVYRTESNINNNTQPIGTSLSTDSEWVENIAENIPYVSETLSNTSDNYEQSSTENTVYVPSNTNADHLMEPTIQFKSFVSKVNNQEDIDDELCLPFSYQYMFDKRTSPWEMKDWDHEDLSNFAIEPEKIDRLYHMVADDEDQNFRSWEICCRMDYKGEKHFVEMYANCDYTGFDCQGGGHISITKLPDFFLENMVTMDQNPDQIYKSLREDGYNVQEPDLLHKVHPKFWNNAPMLKYLCHNAIYKHRDVLPHFKDELPSILANSVDDFIKAKDWDNE